MTVRRLLCIALPITLMACAEKTEEQVAADTTAATTTEASVPAAAGTSSGVLDPNTATAEQLATVPNLDAARAAAIVQGRPYADMRGVNAVLTGLTDEQRDSVFTHVWIPADINKATAEEMELIPGVGPKMRHEFEEYRPFTSVEQFRREIGKYVDDVEVARLEKFFVIPATTTTP